MLLLLPLANATDTWSTIRTGVDYLHRVEAGTQDIYAARIDLTQANIGLHASNDDIGTERHVTTSTFASNADVLVAINGDWSDGTTPVGLAISDGWLWHDHIPDDTVGGEWGYFACTATKTCTIDTEQPLDTAWWFGSPTIAPYRYFQAIGANGIQLLDDGVARSGCFDSIQNPRSAVCTEVDGTTLWLVVVDGRSSSADGMTCDETRDLLLGFGCWDAAMLDGGGSSTLVIEGDVKNNPSDGSQRTVSNFLGIVYSETTDAECQVASGRWCDGTWIGTCQGGRYLGGGDCAAYGASCEEDGDYAYCVDYRCPGGDGNSAVCTDATNFASCTDGQYGGGDCGVFGLLCGTDASGSACMDSRCENGPNSTSCTDAGLYAACTAGTYAEGDCAAYGLVCWEDDTRAQCVDARCTSPDTTACTDAGVYTSCTAGAYAETDCAALGDSCDATIGCVDPGDTDPGDTDPGDTDPGDTDTPVAPLAFDADAVRLDELGRCACESGGGARLGVFAALFAWIVRRPPSGGGRSRASSNRLRA